MPDALTDGTVAFNCSNWNCSSNNTQNSPPPPHTTTEYLSIEYPLKRDQICVCVCPGLEKLTYRIKVQSRYTLAAVTLLDVSDTAASQCVISLGDENLLTDERRVRHRVRVERARVTYIIRLLAPFRQLHLYYVLVSPVEHDAHVSVLAEKERTGVSGTKWIETSTPKLTPQRVRLNCDGSIINFLIPGSFKMGFAGKMCFMEKEILS